MKNHKCPVAVVLSCRTREQLFVADRYVRLWLRRKGLAKNSDTARVLWNALHIKSFRFMAPLLVLVLVGCGKPRTCENRWTMPTGAVCSWKGEVEGRPFFSSCTDGAQYLDPDSWVAGQVCDA